MQVINYFESNRQAHWLEEIRRCDWSAGIFLYDLLRGDELISFCTYAEKDDIQPTELTPWMGFVYTFPAHRGHRYVGKLLEEIDRIAKEDGTTEVYISTNHIGLYEKYGCEFKTLMNDMDGTPSRVYVKKISLQ